MRSKLIVLACMILSLSCGQEKKDTFESFGASVSPEGASAMTTFLAGVADDDSVAVKFTAEIDQVCQMKGCWMTLKTADGRRVRVTFQDYGFFVPKDAGGREAVIEGLATAKELDVETARHYAEDAGREFNEETDRTEISVVASGVLIRKEDQL